MVRKWSVPYPAVGGEELRDAYVYLPVGYEEEPERRYPVLYMFDGQNVFWDEDATYGKSWGIERFLDENAVPLIVAALQCNPGPNGERLAEYSPYRFDDDEYGHFDGCGRSTMRWYIREFKPYIDENFRTLPDREHTFIAGSSMGGLMSLYALFAYGDVYGRAAALSPSIWVAPDRLAALAARSAYARGAVLYMDYGSQEMGGRHDMRRGLASFGAKLVERGVYLTGRIVPDGAHSEASWERQLPFMFETLLYGLDI